MLAPSPRAPVRVLDLCTGTGCIPLLLCAQWPPGSTLAVGVDISPAALELAAENAAVCSVPTSTPAPASTNVFVPFRGDLRDYLMEHLASAASLTRQYYDAGALARVLTEHLNGRQNHEKLLWSLLNLEIWHRQYA